MQNRDDRDERNRGEFSGGELSGPYARDGGWSGGGGSGDYARDRGWSGGGSRDDYARDTVAALPPSHRGKGPKNYRRADSRIEEEVNEALTQDHHVDASDIVVSVSEGEVTLTGIVGSRAMKRRAEEVVERCAGVRDVFNNLRIQNDAEFQMGKARE
jgi:osmotically-inducible protein OsmY